MSETSGTRRLDAAALVAAGRTPPVPFRMTTPAGELAVTRLLRVLPAKRVVGEGTLNGRRILAKLFIGKRARQRWQQERDGVAALIAQAIPTPRPVAAPALPAGGYALLTEFLEPAPSLADLWCAQGDAAGNGAGISNLLCPAFALLGRMHARGLSHEDLHFGNFLRVGGETLVVDGDSVRAPSPGTPLGREGAMRNLAILLAQLPPAHDAAQDTFLAAYRTGHPGVQIDRATLAREVAHVRQRRLEAYLAKTMRECTAFAVDRRFDRFVAVVRGEADALAGVIAQPDVFADRGARLKDGNTCTVARVDIAGRSLVVKRYNLRGIGHALGRAFRPSRAHHSWREGHRLCFSGIGTPAPLALIEERAGPLRRRAWLVTEFCPGTRLQELLDADAEPPAAVAAALLDFIAALQRERISHGDLKATNLLWHNGRIVAIDLDAMVHHRSAEAHTRAWRKDRARLLRNWPPESKLACWLDARLPPG